MCVETLRTVLVFLRRSIWGVTCLGLLKKWISLYLPISWLFQMSSHWPHWKAKSSLWALPVSNWGGYIVRFTWWHFFISSYELTVSNELSLTTLKSKEFTLCSASFKKGGYIIRFIWWHFFISSYELTVSNELSLTALKSEEFTLSSASFKKGGYIIRFTWWHFFISSY